MQGTGRPVSSHSGNAREGITSDDVISSELSDERCVYANNNKSNPTTAAAATRTRTEESGQHLVVFGRGRACRVGLTSSVGQEVRGLRIEA